MHRGYVKLWRKFKDSDLWKERRKFSKWEAWEDIFTEANHKPSNVIIGNKIIECGRGQCIKSLVTWMKRWNWGSTYKVRTFLTLLEKLENINTENLTITTRITICNYETYQEQENAKKTETKRMQHGDKTHANTNNNDKNVNNDKNKRFIPPTIDEVRKYIKEKEYDIDPVKWWHHYNAKNWMIGKNKMAQWHSAIATWLPEKKTKKRWNLDG